MMDQHEKSKQMMKADEKQLAKEKYAKVENSLVLSYLRSPARYDDVPENGAFLLHHFKLSIYPAISATNFKLFFNHVSSYHAALNVGILFLLHELRQRTH